MNKNKVYYWLFAFLSFFLSFVVYFTTTNRHLTFTDNGELMGVCRTLGIAHPTGYPLFTILGYLWSLLPLSQNQIFQMNLFSAFWTSASVVVFYLSTIELLRFLLHKVRPTRKFNKNQDEPFEIYPLALITALVYAFGSIIWSEATSLEVYSLQLFLFNFLFFITFLLIKNFFDEKLIILFALVFGLSFANHLTTVLFVPIALYIFLFKFEGKIRFDPQKIFKLLPAFPMFLIGITLYLYLPLRSSQFPIFDWGRVARSFDKFWYHVSGKQYRVWMFSSTDVIGVNFEKFLDALLSQLHWVGLIIVLIGMIFLFIKNKILFWLIIIAILSCLVYSLNYRIPDIQAYFSLAMIGFCFFFAVGSFYIYSRFRNYYLLTSIVPIILLLLNFKENNESNNNLVENYTRILVNNLEPNAIVISSQWAFFCSAFWYLQQVEKFRPDVVLIEKELLRRTWYIEQLRRWYPKVINKSAKEINEYLQQLELFESEKPYDPNLIQTRFVNLLHSFIEKNINERPIYVTFDILSDSYDAIFLNEYYQKPTGFAIKISKQPDTNKIELSHTSMNQMITGYYNPNDFMVRGIFEAVRVNLENLLRYSLQLKDTSNTQKLYSLINKLPQAE